MTAFESREQNFEAGYWHDQDLAFRIRTRRDKLFGLWAAGKLGMHGAEAEKYALEVVDCDLAKHGPDCVCGKVKDDLRHAGIGLSDHRLHKKLEELTPEAKRQIMSEQETMTYRTDAVEHLIA
jgi:hypothetical protein